MISFADQLIELVTLWKEFVETEERTDKAAFARWILEKDGRNDAIDQYDNDIQAYFSEADYEDAQNAEISMLWGQIDNYRALIFKHILKSLDLNGIDEYTLLLYVDVNAQPSKKDYVKASKLEPTTCFEMIKRLQRKGFLTEAENKEDRRSTILKITHEGKTVLEDAKMKLNRINRHMYIHIPTSDKKVLISDLKKMIATVSDTLETATSKGF